MVAGLRAGSEPQSRLQKSYKYQLDKVRYGRRKRSDATLTHLVEAKLLREREFQAAEMGAARLTQLLIIYVLYCLALIGD